MKHFLLSLLLFPTAVSAQYQSDAFCLETAKSLSHIDLGLTISEDTILSINSIPVISGLTLSGAFSFKTQDQSYVRVTLIDDHNYEFLVYDNYPLLSDSLSSVFSKIALETVLLDDVKPKYLRVETKDAELRLETITITTETGKERGYQSNSGRRQTAQADYVVRKLNQHLSDRKMTWRADVTSVSNIAYEEKKHLFGGTVPFLYGLEYYSAGLFVWPSENGRKQLLNSTEENSDAYVSSWDWRDRHGKNWITPVKNHVNCGGCWAFASVAAVEAYANLYYNDTINVDLSEEEIISCSREHGCSGGTEYQALSYIMNNGIVNESCFQWIDSESDCSNKCNNPDERLFIGGYQSVSISENNIKQHLFRCPLTIAVGAWTHSMLLVGYKKIEAGDKIYLGNTSGANYIIVDSVIHQDMIGRTAWLMKNSWLPWGDNGYLYVLVDVNYNNIWRVISATGSVSSLNYTDADIICEDGDGDGFYNWGIGPKPSSCPSWAPNTPDGDDSDYQFGPIDEYGNLTDLSLMMQDEIVIDSTVVYGSRRYVYNNIRVVNGGKLTVSDLVTLYGSCSVFIESGGELVIDGGMIENAVIQLNSGCMMTIKNDGVLSLRHGYNYYVPIGAEVNMEYGKVLNN